MESNNYTTYSSSSSTSETENDEEEDKSSSGSYEDDELFEIKLDHVQSGVVGANIKLVCIEEVQEDVCECEEEEEESNLFSFDFRNWRDCVYVGIGMSESSMEALVWTLNYAVKPSTTVVCLVHVFPQIRYIPSPLGNLPRSQVNPKQVKSYMINERAKRKESLNKFIDICSAAKVAVDTKLIESDDVGKAILDIIPLLYIRKLVLGISKTRKSRSRRGNVIVDQILEKAKEFCDLKVICEGREVNYQMVRSPISPPSPSLSPSLSPRPTVETMQGEDQPSSCIVM